MTGGFRLLPRWMLPGAVVFAFLALAYIAFRALSFWCKLSVLMFAYGLLPGLLVGAIACTCYFQWRLHRGSGLSVLVAPILVFILGACPHWISSPIGWAANVVRVCYFKEDLEGSYLDAKKEGQRLPVGQIAIDGFGSLTSGLAYDPSGEIERPPGTRSRNWQNGAGTTEMGINNLEVHHIVGAYYYWFHD